MNIDVWVVTGKTLLFPGLASFLALGMIIHLIAETACNMVGHRGSKGASRFRVMAVVLSQASAWPHIKLRLLRIIAILSLVSLTFIAVALPTYSEIPMVDEDLNFALIIFLLTAYPLAATISFNGKNGALKSGLPVMLYGILAQLSLLGAGLQTWGWDVSDLMSEPGRGIKQMPLLFVAAVFSLAMLYVTGRSRTGASPAVEHFRLIDLFFILAGASVLEVGFLSLSPGTHGLLGFVGCFFLLRITAELIIRLRLTESYVLCARITGFVIVVGLVAREFLF